MDRRKVYGCISTFDRFVNTGYALMDFIEAFTEIILKPLNRELKITIEGPRMREKNGIFNKAWEDLKKPILEGKVSYIRLYHFDDNLGSLGLYKMPITILITNNLDINPAAASSVEFAIAKWLYEGTSVKDMQEEYVRLLEKLNLELKGLGGFITIDNLFASCDRSPHEAYVGLAYHRASRQFNRYYRGYHWGNILSATHVELLGGAERVAREAPVYKTELLEDGGMFLQLTEDIENVADDDLRRLKYYFMPILPPKTHPTYYKSYEHLRVITDECTD
jgi:hypothetical protein